MYQAQCLVLGYNSGQNRFNPCSHRALGQWERQTLNNNLTYNPIIINVIKSLAPSLKSDNNIEPERVI